MVIEEHLKHQMIGIVIKVISFANIEFRVGTSYLTL